MQRSEQFPVVLVIIGPTAVGKTELSLQLAERINGEIISMDSRLMYRGMDIGTAKPSPAELARVKHHLINVADPDTTWSLAVYRKMALEKIDQIHAERKIPILVGGTGQYIRALMEGWVIPAQKPDELMRKVLEQWGLEIGPQVLHQKLTLLDPHAAMGIEPNNLRRTVRALEVILKTGKKFSEQREKDPPRLKFWLIGLSRPRVELYQRVDERIDKMFDDGFVDEVKGLIQKGYSANLPPFSAIGYREVCGVIAGELSEEEAKKRMKRETREFIRRQANWFKPDDPQIHWYSMEPYPLEAILSDLRVANIL